MVRIYGIVVSNLPATTEPLALQHFFKRHELQPYELQLRSYVTCKGDKTVELRKACVHFLNKSDKDRAIVIANGVKFVDNKIKAESCLCEKPFVGGNARNTSEAEINVPKKPSYRRKKPVLKPPQVGGSKNKTEVFTSKNSSKSSSRASRHSHVSEPTYICESLRCSAKQMQDCSQSLTAESISASKGNNKSELVVSDSTKKVNRVEDPKRGSHQSLTIEPARASTGNEKSGLTVSDKTKKIHGVKVSKRDCSQSSVTKPVPASRGSCKSERAVSSETKKIHGVKVSNLHSATTSDQIKEHFKSRNFTVDEAALYSSNSQDTIACVHFTTKEHQLRAIRETDGTLLRGFKITVEPCCCKRTLREKGYRERSSANARYRFSTRAPFTY